MAYYYPKLEQEVKNIEVEHAVRDKLIKHHALILTWFKTICDEIDGQTPLHINHSYRDIFLKEKDKDVKFVKDLAKDYGEIFIAFRKNLYRDSEEFAPCYAGFKMIPLNMKEVQEPIKIRYKPWKEYLVSKLCNDLLINMIAPNYSFIYDWFYIKNSKKGLFDNTSQYERMKNSEIAKEVVRVLLEAQRNTYIGVEVVESLTRENDQIKKWINNKFKKLSDKIDDPIAYCSEEIIMSEVTLAFANENVGRTFAELLDITKRSNTLHKRMGTPFKDEGYTFFAKYMFDICYGLFVLNSRIGALHGDFHLNNASIGHLLHRELYEKDDYDIEKDRVLYHISADTEFLFPNNGYGSFVIDFSRAIINPKNIDMYRDKSLPANYQIVSNEEKFSVNEMNNLLNLYIQLFPNKMKQKDELVVIFKNYFDAIFKLLTAIDTYMFTIRLLRVFRQPDHKTGDRIVSLVEKIHKISELCLTNEVNKLIEDTSSYSKKILSDDYPMLKIMKECFAEFMNPEIIDPTKYVLKDVFNYENEMKYSMAKYDLIPEIVKDPKYVNENGKLVQFEESWTANYKKYYNLHESRKIKNLEMMNYIAIRHYQKFL